MPQCELHEKMDEAIQDHETRIRDLEADSIGYGAEIKGLRQDLNVFFGRIEWAIKWFLGIFGTIAGSLIIYLIIKALGG